MAAMSRLGMAGDWILRKVWSLIDMANNNCSFNGFVA